VSLEKSFWQWCISSNSFISIFSVAHSLSEQIMGRWRGSSSLKSQKGSLHDGWKSCKSIILLLFIAQVESTLMQTPSPVTHAGSVAGNPIFQNKWSQLLCYKWGYRCLLFSEYVLEYRRLLQQRDQLIVHNGVLWRCYVHPASGATWQQLIVPTNLCTEVLHKLTKGHVGAI